MMDEIIRFITKPEVITGGLSVAGSAWAWVQARHSKNKANSVNDSVVEMMEIIKSVNKELIGEAVRIQQLESKIKDLEARLVARDGEINELRRELETTRKERDDLVVKMRIFELLRNRKQGVIKPARPSTEESNG